MGFNRMPITRRILSALFILACASDGVLAYPCGALSCVSQTDAIRGYNTTSGHAPASMPLGAADFSTPQRIEAATIGTQFARYPATIVYRNDWWTAPSNYQTLVPPPALGQTGSLDLDPVADFAVFKPPALFDYLLVGYIGPAAQPPVHPFRANTGALSILYDLAQNEIGIDILGIDQWDVIDNPSSMFYVTFFGEDGAVLDNVSLDVGRGATGDCDFNDLFGTPPCARHLMFQTANGAATIKGITISTSDTSGLNYTNLAYRQVAEPPVASVLLLPLMMLVWKRYAAKRSGDGMPREHYPAG